MLDFSPKHVDRNVIPGLNTLVRWTTRSSLKIATVAPHSIHVFPSTIASSKSTKRIELHPEINVSNVFSRQVNPNVQPYQPTVIEKSKVTTPRAILEHSTLKTTIIRTLVDLIPSKASNKDLNLSDSSINYSTFFYWFENASKHLISQLCHPHF